MLQSHELLIVYTRLHSHDKLLHTFLTLLMLFPLPEHPSHILSLLAKSPLAF